MATTTMVELSGTSAAQLVAEAVDDAKLAERVNDMNPNQAATAIAEACLHVHGEAKTKAEKLHAAWSVACALVAKSAQREESKAARDVARCAAAAARREDQTEREAGLQALVRLCNVCTDANAKAEVANTLLQAADAKADREADRIARACATRVLDWIREWDVATSAKTELLERTVELQKKRKDPKRGRQDARNVREARLTMEEGQVETMAKEAVADFLSDPNTHRTTLLESKAVEKMKASQDAVSRDMYALLEAVMSGDVQAASNTSPQVEAMLKAFGGNLEGCKTKARLLALAALGGDAVVQVPYQEVAQALHVDVEEVEALVVEAVGHQVADAKLDQLKQVVVISTASRGIFGIDEWRSLRSRIGAWRDGVTALNKKVGAIRQPPTRLAA